MKIGKFKSIFFLMIILMPVFGSSDEPGISSGYTVPSEVGYPNAQLKHPGCYYSIEDLNSLPAIAESEKSSYNKFKSTEYAQIDYQAKGPFEVVGREPNLHLREYESDGTAVYYQAIQWVLTKNDQYAKNAMNILRSWSITHKEWSGSTARLTAGDTSMKMSIGAEILRSCYTGWDSELNTLLQAYFMNVVWPVIGGNTDRKTLESLSAANQGSMILRGAIAVAVFLDDKDLFDNVMESVISDPAGGLLSNFLPTGQYSDFGRDMGHGGGMVMDWARISEVAYHQGIDLFDFQNCMLEKAIEYYCEYMQTSDDWTDRYQLFGAQYGWYRSPSSNRGSFAAAEEDRRNDRHDWLTGFYLYKGAYENRKSHPMLKWTNIYADRVENVHKLSIEDIFLNTRLKTSETASIPIVKPVQSTPVSPLTLTTEGTKCGANLNVNDGKYTLSGRGHMSGDCSFAYYKMQGDGVLIAKLNNLTSNTTARPIYAGLMIRSILDADSDHSWVYTNNYQSNFDTTFYNKFYNYRYTHSFDPREAKPMFPIWFKIERKGNRIASYDSFDGVTWVANGFRYYKNSEDMSSEYLIGIVTTCNDNTKRTTVNAEFTDVQLLKYQN